MEIFAIKKDWTVLKEFESAEEAEKYSNPECFQILYRLDEDKPVCLFKQF